MVKSYKGLVITTFVLGLLFFAFPRKAYAYLDPGTGSFFLQVLIAALLGGLFAIKIFWNKIKAFFGNLLSRRKEYEKGEK
jgi:hypothetical protein